MVFFRERQGMKEHSLRKFKGFWTWTLPAHKVNLPTDYMGEAVPG